MRSLLLLSLLACTKPAPAVDAAPSPAAPIASSAPAPSAVSSAAPAGPKTCRAEPPGGLVLPAAARSQDYRLAGVGPRTLVTWLEPASSNPNEAMGARRARGRVFDASKGAFDGEELALDESQYGDVILSGIVPLAADALEVAGCRNDAPSGILYCYRGVAGAKTASFAELDFVNGGPQDSGVAGIGRGKDTLLFVPIFGGGQVVAVTSQKPVKRARTFNQGAGPSADSLTAAPVDEATALAAWRYGSTVQARRFGWDEKPFGAVLAISEKGQKVGAPAIMQRGAHSAIVYAARKSDKEPWALVRAQLDGDRITRTPLGVGEATGATFGQAHGACIRASWVEGSGSASVTKVGDFCGDAVAPEHVVTLSQAGVEAGRAWLTGTGVETVLWQEFPGGKQQLRIAKLSCD